MIQLAEEHITKHCHTVDDANLYDASPFISNHPARFRDIQLLLQGCKVYLISIIQLEWYYTTYTEAYV